MRIELLNIEPLIWRRVQIDGKASLAALHHVIGVAFGWSDAHLHEFDISGRLYGNLKQVNIELQEDVLDGRKQVIAITATEVEAAFSYQYDLGDGWEHRIVVERIEAIDEPVGYARVLAGERACPQEDVGGPGGYAALIACIQGDSTSEEARRYFD